MGAPAVAAAPSARQAARATGLANQAASGLTKKASSELFQVGSSSDRYRMSKSIKASALQRSSKNRSSRISSGKAYQ